MRFASIAAVLVMSFGMWVGSAAAQGCGCGCGEGAVCACGPSCCGGGETGGEGAGEGAAFTGQNMALRSRISWTQFGNTSARGNDIWGWVDSTTQREYALVGRTDGTSFVDVTDPVNPQHLGFLPRTAGTPTSTWRAIKVYNDHAFIGADFAGNHGLQVFDLTRLRGLSGPPQTFAEDAHFSGFQTVHTLALNPATGFLYAAGTNVGNGLYMIDVRNPRTPTFAGFSTTSTYTHETQVISYGGPDTTYQGREIAFSSAAGRFTIVDVNNKSSTTVLSSKTYPNIQFSHQGWLTEDQRYFVMNDELDEQNLNLPTRTHIWDVQDLNNPSYVGYYQGTSNSIDHNLYIRGGYAYLSNYTTGLRVVDIRDLPNLSSVEEVGYFDTYMQSDARSFNGAWTNYPYFPSGNIIVNDINNGLFVVSPVQVRGDANWDGRVTGADFTIWADNFGQFTSGATRSDGDFNDDGVVTGADYTLWADMLGQGPLDGTTIYQGIPEPSSLVLAAIALGAFLYCSGRNRR